MSDKNQNWQEDTQFEQKLAAYKPRMLRDVKSAVLQEMQPLPIQLVEQWHEFEQKARPYLWVGACCFLLGAVVMFGIMTCFFDYGPTRSRQLLANKPPQTSTTYTMPLSMKDLDEVRTPADLARLFRQQPTVTINNSTPEPPETQRDILRAFGDISRI